jgi:hypothetical protein
MSPLVGHRFCWWSGFENAVNSEKVPWIQLLQAPTTVVDLRFSLPDLLNTAPFSVWVAESNLPPSTIKDFTSFGSIRIVSGNINNQ